MSTQLSDEQAVREAVANFNRAALACDSDALAALLGEGLVYSHSNALLENKAECISGLLGNRLNFVMEDGWTVQIYGRCAVVRGHVVAHMVDKNPPTSIKLDMQMVWAHSGDAWLLVARHTAKVPV